MDYISIIKHLLISIIIKLCVCTMPLNSKIDIGVKSNITFQHVCFVHEFQTVLSFKALEHTYDMKRVLYRYGIIIIILLSMVLHYMYI